MKHFYEGGSALPDVEQRRTFRIQRKLKTFLNSFQCLLLSLSAIYYQFSCNVQKSRASGTTGCDLGRDNRERGFIKERLLRIVHSESRRSAGVLLTIFCVLFSFASVVEAQAQEPRNGGATGSKVSEISIGHKVPEEFWTKEHLFYINGDTVRKTLEEHKGKMIVLDFYSSGCAVCLVHQKDIKTYTDKYKDDLVVIMVNSVKTRDNYYSLDSLYHKGYFDKFQIYDFESIIEDDYLMQFFPYSSYPHYVWITYQGRLQLRTYRNLLDPNYVAPFIMSK
ncbi:hypothetical protein ORI89_08295 [Sphingobacterium sp. UT-1RO-CII-1]|uniref:TlpA family protein disulfide reductase n=1 Tax=Sphingobacterium sp. UT-1RO-CII-1 TaxID=2995225 RepID=UPI00227B4E2C|nr:hypothetical protein [Sphingobacterium sp. UT-1RO-CII-1]MCY4779649.1 hypothetical protein [Sphingobacterium sp. UT-1RO-CII-1]